MAEWKKVVVSGSIAQLANETFISGHITASGIVKAEHLFSTDDAQITDDLIVGGDIDLEGNIDVNGTANLDVVDIDGAVNIAAATTIATNNKIQFRDSAIYLASSADGQLDIVADDEVQIATTLVDINGNLDVSGTTLVTGVLTSTAIQVVNGGLALATNKKIQFRDSAIFINSDADANLQLVADTNIVFKIGSTDQFKLADGAILPATTNDIDLGSKALQFKNIFLTGDISASGHTHIVGDITSSAIIKAEHFHSTDDAQIDDDLTVGGDIDLEGSIDVNGTANLDVVDIDGAVNMATTALVTGVLTTTAIQVVNGGLALATDKKIQFRDSGIFINSNADGSLTVDSDSNIIFAIGSAAQVLVADGSITPNNTNDVDLGSATKKFKNLFLTGDVTASGHMHVVGDITSSATIKADTLEVTTFSPTNLSTGNITASGYIHAMGDITASGILKGEGLVITDDALITDDLTVNGDIDLAGSIDVDGTMEADAITVGGTALNTVIAGVTVTNSTNAAHVLITDNESTNENNQITFIEGAGGGGANRGLEADGDLLYNPSKGLVIAPNFSASGHIHAAGDITSSAIIKAEHFHSTDDAQIDDDLTVGGDIDLEGSIDVNGTANLDVVDIDGAVNVAAALTMATTNKIQFRDTAIYINSDADGYLEAVADTGITFKIGSTEQILIADGKIEPTTTNDIDLGSAAKKFKNLFLTGDVTASGHMHVVGDITSSAIIKAEHFHSTDDAQIDDDLTVGGDIDLEGSIDVNGTANLDVVDIDGAVNVAAALTMATTNKIQFRDTAIYINSDADGHLEAVADTGISFKIGSTEQIILTDGLLAPTTTNDVDLGSATKKFKNLFLTGDITASGHAHVVGDITASGVLKGATGNIAGALVAATLDTGQGANELYDMDQNVKTTNAVTFTTVNTGQGANELYGMDQAVKTNSNVTFADLQVDGDLVVAGTASFTNTTNLEIKDRFISLASGSTSVGDGGIVVNHFGGTYPSGSAFGYEGGTANRWAVQNEFAPTGSTFAPDAYMGIVTFSTSVPSGNPTYGGANYGYGNIHVETDTGDIFIFA